MLCDSRELETPGEGDLEEVEASWREVRLLHLRLLRHRAASTTPASSLHLPTGGGSLLARRCTLPLHLLPRPLLLPPPSSLLPLWWGKGEPGGTSL